MHARSLALLPDCHGTSSIFAPRYCAPGEWVALAPTNGQQLSEEEHLARAAETHASKELLRAEHHYHAALALNPHNGEAYYRLARLWQHRSNETAGNLERAIGSLRQAVAVQPLHDGAYHHLGLLLQVSGDTEGAAEARRSFEELWSHAGARRMLGPRLWSASDLAHHLQCAGVPGVSSSRSGGDGCGALLVSELGLELSPHELLRRCGVAVRHVRHVRQVRQAGGQVGGAAGGEVGGNEAGAGVDGEGGEAGGAAGGAVAAVAAVARLQALLRARRSAALRLLGPTGAHCTTVAGRDGQSLLASAWFDHASGGVLRSLRYASLVLSCDLCAAHARAAAVRWLMMSLVSIDEPGAARWLSHRAVALRLAERAEQSARVGSHMAGL